MTINDNHQTIAIAGGAVQEGDYEFLLTVTDGERQQSSEKLIITVKKGEYEQFSINNLNMQSDMQEFRFIYFTY